MTTMNQLKKEMNDIEKKLKAKNNIKKLEYMVGLKQKYNDLLNVKIHMLNELKFDYENKKSDLLLNTDWSKVIDGRVTNDLKEAYIREKSKEVLEKINVAEEDVNIIKKDIDLLNDYISIEKYSIRMILK